MNIWPSFEEDEISAINAFLRYGKVNYWTGEEGRMQARKLPEWGILRL